MAIRPKTIRNLKDILLALSVIYFYGLGFALQFHRATYGLEAPAVFLTMNALFLLAIGLEITLAWWDKKVFVFWCVLGVISYGIIGLYVAPAIYGSWILPYVFLEPLIVVFVGGVAFGFGHVVAQHVFSAVRMAPEQVRSSLSGLPGWRYADDRIDKTFRFKDFIETLNFVNQVGAIINETHHHIEFHMTETAVTIVLTTPDEKGVTLTDINHAKKFDAF